MLKDFKLPIIIAECGNNHEGNFDTACELLEKAKESGADLIKFQAGTAEGFARKEKQIPFYKKFELGLYNYKRLMQLGKKMKKTLKEIFIKEVGYSDHTIGVSTCITAVRNFGAIAIEKHFTLPWLKITSSFRDHIHSVVPEEFAEMVNLLKGD